MIIKNVTVTQMEVALAIANRAYDGNLQFNRFEPRAKCIGFTLRVKSSKAPGHRLSYSGRHLTAACWHAHRDFMRAIFDIAPNAVLRSCHAVYDGVAMFEANYRDTGYKNIGSMMQPLDFQNACEC
jgi:hypothetical protein